MIKPRATPRAHRRPLQTRGDNDSKKPREEMRTSTYQPSQSARSDDSLKYGRENAATRNAKAASHAFERARVVGLCTAIFIYTFFYLPFVSLFAIGTLKALENSVLYDRSSSWRTYFHDVSFCILLGFFGAYYVRVLLSIYRMHRDLRAPPDRRLDTTSEGAFKESLEYLEPVPKSLKRTWPYKREGIWTMWVEVVAFFGFGFWGFAFYSRLSREGNEATEAGAGSLWSGYVAFIFPSTVFACLFLWRVFEVSKTAIYPKDQSHVSVPVHGLGKVSVVPSDDVEKPSMVERCQIRFERLIGQSCYWWPMKQPTMVCKPGFGRISWSCSCGESLHIDLPEDEAVRFVHSASAQTRNQGNGRGSIIPLYNTRSPRSSSQADANTFSSRSDSVTGSSDASNSTSPRTTSDAVPKDFGLSPDRESFIHWCVDETEATTRLVELDTKTVCETTLIQKLKKAYSRIRRFRNWTSLTECVGVRFIKFRRIYTNQDIITCGSLAFPDPTNFEYEYDPYEPPEISQRFLEEELRHHFERGGCCTRYGRTDIIQRIPKKVPRKFDGRCGIEGYGMLAVNQLALWRWAVLVLLTQLGPGVFAIHWLLQHPGDLQNAFMPSGMILALLAIFRPSGETRGSLMSTAD